MTHAFPLTARARAAIAVIQVHGNDAADILAALTPRARTLPLHQFARTTLKDPHTGNPLDDILLLRTAPDTYELHLHGGLAVTDAVLAALEHAGATLLTPDQALLAPDPLRNEFLHTLPRASTHTGARLLARQLTSGLTAWIAHWQAWLDSGPPSNDLWRLHSAAQWLLLRSAAFERLLTPARIAIIGPPNAGKSTLANALLGRPVSITSDTAGTTRDWVDAAARFTTLGPDPLEIPITLIDTAGVRPTPDPLEQQSIHRTHQQAGAADLILLLLDATNLPSEDELTLLHQHPDTPTIIALNKSDILPPPPHSPLPAAFPHAIPISAKTRAGLDILMHTLLTHLDLHALTFDEPFAFTPRQRSLLTALSLTTDIPSARALLHALAPPASPRGE